MTVTELELGWCAGFFDGEGSITVQKVGIYRYPHLQLSNTDRSTLVRFTRYIGYGKIYESREAGMMRGQYNCKALYAWHCFGARCYPVMDQLYPLLSERRQLRWLEVTAMDTSKILERGTANE